MTLYQWLLFGHVAAAVIWVGGGIMDLILSRRLAGRGPEVDAAFGEARAWAGSFVFGPAAFAVLIFGILLVATSPAWSFTQPWVLAALVLVVALLAVGGGFFGPEEKRLAAMRGERGPDDPELLRRTRRLETLGNLEMVALALILSLMIFKPGV